MNIPDSPMCHGTELYDALECPENWVQQSDVEAWWFSRTAENPMSRAKKSK
jgi:hypothetical protein